MALNPLSVGDAVQTPGISAEIYNPDQLIAGNQKIVTDSVNLGAGVLARGTVLGQITASGNYILCVKTAVDGTGASNDMTGRTRCSTWTRHTGKLRAMGSISRFWNTSVWPP